MLTVDVHLGLSLVVLQVPLGLLGLVASDGADDRVLLALETVSGTDGVSSCLYQWVCFSAHPST